MKKYTKSIIKEFRTGFARFIAITAIIALGVGFMIGITQTTPDMKSSMDRYYTASNAYDINIKAPLGLTDDDIEAICNIDGTGNVMPYISSDAVMNLDSSSVQVTARINGVNFDRIGESGDGINLLSVEEGRLPENDDECVVQRPNNYFAYIPVGSTLTIDTDGQGNISSSTLGDVYADASRSLTVVGIVSSPEYYYIDAREVTTIGNGVLGAVVYTYGDFYDLSKGMGGLYALLGASYTDAAVVLKDSGRYTVFTDAYEEYVLNSAQDYATLGSERVNAVWETYGALAEAFPGGESLSSVASWYILDIVSTNYSYVGFRMNADKVSEIAGVFPVFFIIVAALVALTSMTRTVEEQRGEIGTLKALGYSNAKIINKYIIYCCAACLLGCVIGALLGFSIIPLIIWAAYGTLYYLPSLSLAFSPVYTLIVIVVALAITVLVTLYASRSTIKEKPSELMQQKAPAAGKRIVLERCGPLWRCLPFRYKATVRNIFRYKRNMLLTIISVMGCTALVFAGFAFSGIISDTVDLHFNDLQRFELSVKYDAESDGLSEFVAGNDAYLLYSENGTVVFGGKSSGTQTVTLYAVPASPGDRDGMDSFISLRTRKGEEISLNDGEIALCWNYANSYGVNVGDTVTYRQSGGTETEFTVGAIAENYVDGVIYVGYDYYMDLIGADSASGYNTYLVNLTDGELLSGYAEYDELVSYVTSELFTYDGVTSVTFSSDTRSVYSGITDMMVYIELVLLICAGALVAIVLYNLTSINIDERKREIATLKVLGYTRGEVAGYIYRESAVLTVVGALLGLGLGALLAYFLMVRMNNAAISFTFLVSWWVYLVSFAITVAFAAIVYAFMTIKLNRTDMAESLKSNE